MIKVSTTEMMVSLKTELRFPISGQQGHEARIIHYWTQTNPPYEVDFLIQRENDIFPVEVKSEANTTSRSLKKFKELFPDQVKLRVRFSLDNLKLDDDVLNIPLFMADQADRLIGAALEQYEEKSPYQIIIL